MKAINGRISPLEKLAVFNCLVLQCIYKKCNEFVSKLQGLGFNICSIILPTFFSFELCILVLGIYIHHDRIARYESQFD